MRHEWFDAIPHNIARNADKAFFERNPSRKFLARPYVNGDIDISPATAFFAEDETGATREVNLIVIKRVPGARIRLAFAVSRWPNLRTDAEIVWFLRSRGISPVTLKAVVRR